MKVYFIRHTSVSVPKSICYGQSDVDLSDTFEQEAQLVKDKIESLSFDAAFTSPLTRCRRLADYCGYPNAIVENRLKEFNFGDWEMQAWDDIDMSIWETEWNKIPAPNGESFEQMTARLKEFTDSLKKCDYEQVVVFAHAGILINAKVLFQGLVPDEAFDTLPDYGEILTVEI